MEQHPKLEHANWKASDEVIAAPNSSLKDIHAKLSKLTEQAANSTVYAETQIVHVSLPPMSVQFVSGSATAPEVKAQMLKAFEKKLDEELAKHVLSGDLKPGVPWQMAHPPPDHQVQDDKFTAEAFKQTMSQLAATPSYSHYLYPPPPGSGNSFAELFGSENSIVKVLKKVFPGAMSLLSECPEVGCLVYGSLPMTTSKLVPHLNDHHKWKTAQIAEWMENTFDAKDLAS